MKRILFIIALLVMGIELMAQEPVPTYRAKGQWTIEPNVALGMFDLSACTYFKQVKYSSLGVGAFYQPSDNIRLGFGTEFAMSDTENTNFGTSWGGYAGFVPVYLNFKCNFWNNKRVSPFVDVRLGYAFSAFPKNLNRDYPSQSTVGNLKAQGQYANIGLGISWRRSELMAGMSVVRYTAHTTVTFHDSQMVPHDDDCVGPMSNFYLRYGYRFGLNHAQPKPVVGMDEAGQMNLSVYGQLGLFDIAVALDHLIFGSSDWVNHVGLGTAFEYRITDGFSLGVGAEFHASSGVHSNLMRAHDKMMLALPVYGDARLYFGHYKVRPFVEARLGYAFPLNTVNVAKNYEPYEVVNDKALPIEWKGAVRCLCPYRGFAAGIAINNHSEVMIGHTSYRFGGMMTSLRDGHQEYRESIMNNIYVRYAYRFNLK